MPAGAMPSQYLSTQSWIPPCSICDRPSVPPRLNQVGVCASRGDALTVLEYSELDPAVASAPDPDSADGALLYNWGNICMHYFSTRWLEKVGCAKGSTLFVGRPRSIAGRGLAHVCPRSSPGDRHLHRQEVCPAYRSLLMLQPSPIPAAMQCGLLSRLPRSSSLLVPSAMQVGSHLKEGAAYHVAKKKIPSKV